MQVTLAVLADWAATTVHGKLVIAGVFETINAPALPATHPMMALALRLAADPGESSNHRLTLRLVDSVRHVDNIEAMIPALSEAGVNEIIVDVDWSVPGNPKDVSRRLRDAANL